MKRKLIILNLLLVAFLNAQQMRLPAYPLITHDPYFSIWSMSDKLNEETTKHWTGLSKNITGIVKVDGISYKILGDLEAGYTDLLANKPTDCKIVYALPSKDWTKQKFDDSKWENASLPIGSEEYAETKHKWGGSEAWIRRAFDVKKEDIKSLGFLSSHDEIIEVYINGEQAVTDYVWCKTYRQYKISEKALKTIKEKGNVIALHCKRDCPPAFLDFTMISFSEQPKINNAVQKSVKYTATQTIYEFNAGKADVTLTFTSPLLISDMEILSRPVSYISYEIKSNDSKAHDVKVYFDASPSIAINNIDQQVVCSDVENASLSVVKAGTVKQEILQKRGDDVRIDWGYLYLASEKSSNAKVKAVRLSDALFSFNEKGTIKDESAKQENSFVTEKNPFVLAYTKDFGSVIQAKSFIMLAYDDIKAVKVFGHELNAWWRKNQNIDMPQLLTTTNNEYSEVMAKCNSFDNKLYSDALNSANKEYADFCIGSYRQAVAAHKLVSDPLGNPLFFSKENYSGGMMATVDVTYPSAPLFLLYNTHLLKGMMEGIFYYSESGKWAKPFAAHDLGLFPIAEKQHYGEDMPVEECGNMIILTAAIAEVEKNPAYAQKHWASLSLWVKYLEQYGFDPANQLCTDDFAGHSARNANLSIKSIVAMACYGKLASQLGYSDEATKYTELAKSLATKWCQMADLADHYALSFGQTEGWSQKYNIIWDKLLKLNLFPDAVRQKEVKYYISKLNTYGLPLDSRKSYTKTDWITWSATLTGDINDFNEIMKPLYKYVSETPDRIPICDWYETKDAKAVGFRARSVAGGHFIKILEKRLN